MYGYLDYIWYIIISAYTSSAFTDKALSGQKNTITTSNRNLFHLIGHVRFKKLTSHMTILKPLTVRIILFPCIKKHIHNSGVHWSKIYLLHLQSQLVQCTLLDMH